MTEPTQFNTESLLINLLLDYGLTEAMPKVASDIRSIFETTDKNAAMNLLEQVAQSYSKSAPQLSQRLLENIPEGLTLQHYPPKKRKKLRTSNMMENINRQIKRRTKVASLFPYTNSIERLVSALLQEISDDWETGRAYILPEH